jgi:cation diffusion facilitator CzcD-associated flavoprotein CzcO
VAAWIAAAARRRGPVLVVGGGNTGFQIAEELSRTHEVHLSITLAQTARNDCYDRRSEAPPVEPDWL